MNTIKSKLSNEHVNSLYIAVLKNGTYKFSLQSIESHAFRFCRIESNLTYSRPNSKADISMIQMSYDMVS